MSEKEKKPKKKKARKWSLGKEVPPEMPDGELMKELKKEIEAMSEKEAADLKKKEQIILNLFISAISTSVLFLFLIFWTLVNYPPFAKDYYEFRTVITLVGTIILWFILLIFNEYAEKSNWKNRRKKGIIIWMLVLFLALSLIMYFAKL